VKYFFRACHRSPKASHISAVREISTYEPYAKTIRKPCIREKPPYENYLKGGATLPNQQKHVGS